MCRNAFGGWTFERGQPRGAVLETISRQNKAVIGPRSTCANLTAAGRLFAHCVNNCDAIVRRLSDPKQPPASYIDARLRPTTFQPRLWLSRGATHISRRLRLEPKHFLTQMIDSPGLRKARGIHAPSLGERRVSHGRDHERYFPDRGRAFHFDWNALKGVCDLGKAQPMRGLGLRKLDG
jgi:hypothetical protein